MVIYIYSLLTCFVRHSLAEAIWRSLVFCGTSTWYCTPVSRLFRISGSIYGIDSCLLNIIVHSNHVREVLREVEVGGIHTHHSEIAFSQFFNHTQSVTGYLVQRRLTVLVLFIIRQLHACELARSEMLFFALRLLYS